MLRRRSLFAATLAYSAPAAFARTAGAAGGPLRVGVDSALVDSGLAAGLKRAFAADTGIAVLLVTGAALAILDAVREGEVDAALCNAPAAEELLEQQGLVHDRQQVAAGEFLLVGPAPRVRGRATPPGRSGVDVLASIREVAAASPAAVTFLSAGNGSGTHIVEQALWRAARIAPAAPWYASADRQRGFIAQVRASGAYAVVERGAWGAQGGEPLSVLVEGDPLLAEAVHAMRSFRVAHPAGKIFIAWIAGRRGQAVVSRHRGYRTYT